MSVVSVEAMFRVMFRVRFRIKVRLRVNGLRFAFRVKFLLPGQGQFKFHSQDLLSMSRYLSGL